MIHVRQTKLYEEGPPVYRGNCVQACVASLFDLPIDSVPDMHGRTDQMLNEWLSVHYPGVVVQSRDETPASGDDFPHRHGYWIATVESPRFTEQCSYHVAENDDGTPKGEPMPPFWYFKDDCPHCKGTGTRPGYHAIVMKGREVVHDPHPDAEGYGYEYVGRFVAATWFYVGDPSRLAHRSIPS